MNIEKKCWPESFQTILDGTKSFDVRLADFACKPGDILVLREWDPKTKTYTGRVLKKEISHVSKTKNMKYWSEKEMAKHGFQILGFSQKNKAI